VRSKSPRAVSIRVKKHAGVLSITSDSTVIDLRARDERGRYEGGTPCRATTIAIVPWTKGRKRRRTRRDDKRVRWKERRGGRAGARAF
jgi:hypothetical protein